MGDAMLDSMHATRGWIGLALGAALSLPEAGTTSRERDFCGQWLALTRGEKHDAVVACEKREADAAWDSNCRVGLRPAIRHKLDAECRNWSRLMEFEVRLLVDGVLVPCGRPQEESPR